MSVARESETNAPVDGNSSANATSRTTNPGAAATSTSDVAMAIPPPTTTARRQRLSPSTPNTGSSTADEYVGTLRSSPICT